MKVVKFGGSSVANAQQISKVLNIFNSDDERRIMIVSAPGKRHPEDTKTTVLILQLYEKVIDELDYQQQFERVIARYADIINR